MVVLGCGVGVAGCDREPVAASEGDIATSGFGESSLAGGNTSNADDTHSGDSRPGPPDPTPDGGVGPLCGDGEVDEGETCDGGNFGGWTCADEGASGGSLRCASDCQIDACDCVWEDGGGDCPADGPPVCGNDVQESGESCDGSRAVPATARLLSSYDATRGRVRHRRARLRHPGRPRSARRSPCPSRPDGTLPACEAAHRLLGGGLGRLGRGW